MANPDYMMFVRPKNCRYCGHGYYGLYHMVQYAQSKGIWNIIDISGEQANKNQVYDAIGQNDPLSFYGFGHGLDCNYTGDSEEDIFTCAECDKLSGRIVYLLSCLTGNGLGPAIMQKGGIAYAGFNISWTWVSMDEPEGDPYTDIYARGFWESANELWRALIDGKTFIGSIQASINKYNEWIDYWYYDNPEAPESQECIKWLSFDRDGLIGLDTCGSITNQIECEIQGCYWYNNSCHGMETPEPSFASVVIPLIVIIGLAYFIGKKFK